MMSMFYCGFFLSHRFQVKSMHNHHHHHHHTTFFCWQRRQHTKNQINTFDNSKIPNQYIVVFKDDVKNPNYLINQIVKRIETSTFKDLDILNIFQNSIKGSLIKINTQSELDKLRHDPNVKYVEQDQKIQSFVQTLPKCINRIDADQSFTKSGNGFGSVNDDIAILDTEIHNNQNLNIFRQKDFTGNLYLATDKNGRGTHVAGTADAKDDTGEIVGVALDNKNPFVSFFSSQHIIHKNSIYKKL